MFLAEGRTQTFSARSDLQWTRQFWDFDFTTTYTYSENGAYALTPGGIGAQTADPTVGTALQRFVTSLPEVSRLVSSANLSSPASAQRARGGRDESPG